MLEVLIYKLCVQIKRIRGQWGTIRIKINSVYSSLELKHCNGLFQVMYAETFPKGPSWQQWRFQDGGRNKVRYGGVCLRRIRHNFQFMKYRSAVFIDWNFDQKAQKSIFVKMLLSLRKNFWLISKNLNSSFKLQGLSLWNKSASFWKIRARVVPSLCRIPYEPRS